MHKPWIYRSIGIAHHFQAHYQVSIENYTEALKYSAVPGISATLPLNLQFSLVWTLLESKQLDQVDRILRKIEEDKNPLLESEPFMDGWFMSLRGRWYMAQGLFAEAEHCYLRSMKKLLEMDGGSAAMTEFLIDFAELWRLQKCFYDAATGSSLIFMLPFVWHWEKKKARQIHDDDRPQLSDNQWTQIQADVASTTLREYVEALLNAARPSLS